MKLAEALSIRADLQKRGSTERTYQGECQSAGGR